MVYDFGALTFRIADVYRSVHPEGHFFVEERPVSLLFYRLSGEGRFRIGDRWVSSERGSVLFVPSGTAFEVEYLVSECVAVELLDCNYREAEVIPIKGVDELSHLFLRLLEGWQARRSQNGAKAALYAILEAIEEDRRAAEVTPFEKCLSYIEENFCDPELDIAAVCRRGFISVSSLQRAFLRRFGLSPMQYVIGLRMEKAVRLLRTGRLSVKEVSYLCGFSDVKYFSRAFRERYGYPPSHLRDAGIYWSEISAERNFSQGLLRERRGSDPFNL